MKNEILKLLNNNDGVITTKQVRENDIDTTYLSIMVKEKSIERVKRGVYVKATELGDEYFSVSVKSSYSTFSHNTSLYFHALSDRAPINYDITVPVGYNGTLQRDKKVNLYYIKKDNFELGRIKIKSPQGKIVYAYDIERSLCDMLRSENRVDKDITVNAFKQYLKSSDRDLFKLKKFAKILKVTNKLNKYLEVLL